MKTSLLTSALKAAAVCAGTGLGVLAAGLASGGGLMGNAAQAASVCAGLVLGCAAAESVPAGQVVAKGATLMVCGALALAFAGSALAGGPAGIHPTATRAPLHTPEGGGAGGFDHTPLHGPQGRIEPDPGGNQPGRLAMRAPEGSGARQPSAPRIQPDPGGTILGKTSRIEPNPGGIGNGIH